MDKRQRLRVKTPETSTILPEDHPMTDITQDSSIIYPQRITARPVSSKKEIDEESSLDFTTFDERSVKDEKISAPPQVQYHKQIVDTLKRYWALPIVFFLFIFFYMKPSDHQFLIDELEKLKKQATMASYTPERQIENILSIPNGVTVDNYSEIYKYGFFKSTASDPNSIIEPGLDNLPLAGQKGFFEIKMKKKYLVRKIGLYHPEMGNPKSAIKEFSVIINEKATNFSFDGKGYQEFLLEAAEADTIRIEYTSNHGETKYTCIYRVFVFA